MPSPTIESSQIADISSQYQSYKIVSWNRKCDIDKDWLECFYKNMASHIYTVIECPDHDLNSFDLNSLANVTQLVSINTRGMSGMFTKSSSPDGFVPILRSPSIIIIVFASKCKP